MIPTNAAAGFNSTDPGLTWAPYNSPTVIPPYIGNGTTQVSSGHVQFDVGTFGNNTYLVQSTSNLLAPWSSIGTVPGSSNYRSFTFTDPRTYLNTWSVYYRVILLQ
jgi:hypothetical protein